MKNTKYVKKEIADLIKKLGGRAAVAERLGVTLRYIYMLESGQISPGARLYRDIQILKATQ